MAIYAMSDIHGMYGPFMRRIKQLNNLGTVKNGLDKLILLGDYIDVGQNSFKVLQTIYELQQETGPDNMIVLMGNHDKWFLDFLNGRNPFWLDAKNRYTVLEAFLSEESNAKLDRLMQKDVDKTLISKYVKSSIWANHKELLTWYSKLPYYYATDTQIFVHAGVDEAAEDLWAIGTSHDTFIEKYPASTGEFYMDIIAGHVSTTALTGNRNNHGIFYDGHSHYYIDGIDSYPFNTPDDQRSIPVLLYTDSPSRAYYSLEENGRLVQLS